MSTGDTPAKLRLLKLAVRDFRGIDKLDLDFTDADGEPLDVIALAGGNLSDHVGDRLRIASTLKRVPPWSRRP